MIDFSPALLTADDADSAVSWYADNLAKVLGLQPGVHALQVEQLGALNGAEQQKALAALVDKRFRRVIDEATGKVHIETMGESDLLADDDQDDFAEAAELSRSYLSAARASLAAIDEREGFPGGEEGETASLLWQAKTVLSLLISVGARRRNAFLTFTYVHELVNEDYGLLPALEQRVRERCGEELSSVEFERTVNAIRAARRAIDCFVHAITEYIDEDDKQTLMDTVEIIRRCGRHIAMQVDLVQDELRRTGIGDCELETLPIRFDSPVVLGGATFETISAAETLLVTKSESLRWVQFAERGRSEQIVAIRQSAIVLRGAVAQLKGDAIVAEFKLDKRTGARVAARVDRMAAYVLTVLDTIIADKADSDGSGGGHGNSPEPRDPKNRRGRRDAGDRSMLVPPDDATDMPS